MQTRPTLRIWLAIIPMCISSLVYGQEPEQTKALPTVYLHAVVATKGVGDSNLLSTKFEQTVREKLSKSEYVKIVTSHGGQDRPDGTPKGSKLLAGLVAAKELYSRRAYEEMVKALRQTLVAFEEKPEPSDRFEDYVEGLSYLGAGYLRLDYGGDAKDAFRQRATLSGEKTLGRDFDKDVTKKYKKVAKKWLKKKKGTVVVTSAQTDTSVALDGGMPAVLDKVQRLSATRGRHRVTCTSGETRRHVWVKVKSGKIVEVDCDAILGKAGGGKGGRVDPSQFVKRVRLAPNDMDTVATGRALAKSLGADYVVVPFMRTSGDGLEVIGTMFSAQAGMTVQIGSFGFGRSVPSVVTQAGVYARSVEGSVRSFPYQNALVLGFLTQPSSRLTDAPLSPRTARNTERRSGRRSASAWHKSWWFWTTTALAVGGLSTAGYFLLTADDKPGKFGVEATW